MKAMYDEIVRLLRTGLGAKLQMDASRIGYENMYDAGPYAPGYLTQGIRETISIPDEYLEQAGIPLADGAAERFLNWLKSQI